MSESEITLVAMVLLLFFLAWLQFQEIRRLRIRAQESDLWAQRWEELAAQAAEEAEQATQRNNVLQRLCAERTVQLLAANSWIVVQRVGKAKS